jgi:hypothetical protein
MQCDFLLPGLFAAANASEIKQLAPALAKLLARGSANKENSDSTETWIAQRLGLEGQPFAAIALLGEPGSDPGTSHWLRADPIHLSINRDRVVMLDGSQLNITSEQADAMCNSLQTHFAGDGLRFRAAHPERWYVASENPIAIDSHPPSAVRGRSIADYGFDGTDRGIWQSRLSEMQMLLHAHPVNEAREAADQLPINGVWFWGAGVLPENATLTYSHIVANDALLAGAAVLTQAHYARLEQFELTALPASARALIALDQLDALAAYGDGGAWREALIAIDQKWFTAALSSLKNGKTSAVTIHVPAKDRGINVTTTRSDLLKFWRSDRLVAH